MVPRADRASVPAIRIRIARADTHTCGGQSAFRTLQTSDHHSPTSLTSSSVFGMAKAKKATKTKKAAKKAAKASAKKAAAKKPAAKRAPVAPAPVEVEAEEAEFEPTPIEPELPGDADVAETEEAAMTGAEPEVAEVEETGETDEGWDEDVAS